MNTNTKTELACGLFISIDAKGEEDMIKALMAPAEKTVEVMVKYKDITKEYTFADFFKRLGFSK